MALILQVFEVSIAQSCDSILNPEAPLALRLSGQLLLGVVRIYQRKLAFLETDARNAIDGLQRKEAGSQNVDLPDGGTAPEMAITLPETDTGALAASDIFPSFAIADTPKNLLPAVSSLSSRVTAGTESLTLADDLSDVFGSSRWTASDERFEIHGSGEDLDRRFSAELERLRSQAAVENPREAGADIFYDPMGADQMSMGGDTMDGIMEPPASDLFVMPNLGTTSSIGRTPGSIGAPGSVGYKITPAQSFGYSDDLPEIGDDDFPMILSEKQEDKRGQPKSKTRPKRRIQMDVTSNGIAATQMPSDSVRKLLNDRSSLLKNRSITSDVDQHYDVGKHMALKGRFLHDICVQSEVARSSFLYRPACFQCLAPELLKVFERTAGVSKGPSTERKEPKKKDISISPSAQMGALEKDVYTDIQPLEEQDEFLPSGALEDNEFPDWGEAGDDFDDDIGYDPIEASQGVDQSVRKLGFAQGTPTLDVVSADGTVLSSRENVPEEVAAGTHALSARDGFTHRTRRVLDHLQSRFNPKTGDKRSRDDGQPSSKALSLDDLVEGKSRLDACRWFFESLVLRNKGFLDLEQNQPYGDILLKPLPKIINNNGLDGAHDNSNIEHGPAPTRQKLSGAVLT